MVNRRNKKRLNSKWANRISMAISIMFFMSMFVTAIAMNMDGVWSWVMLCGLATLGTAIVYTIFYVIIFKGEDRKAAEDFIEKENIVLKYLSYIEFKQVYFFIKVDGDNIDMMRKILQKEECKFYAKLMENNAIYLIAKDKHNEEVYSTEIKNYVYFYSNFKFTE